MRTRICFRTTCYFIPGVEDALEYKKIYPTVVVGLSITYGSDELGLSVCTETFGKVGY